jgi:hypothetical protein
MFRFGSKADTQPGVRNWWSSGRSADVVTRRLSRRFGYGPCGQTEIRMRIVIEIRSSECTTVCSPRMAGPFAVSCQRQARRSNSTST